MSSHNEPPLSPLKKNGQGKGSHGSLMSFFKSTSALSTDAPAQQQQHKPSPITGLPNKLDRHGSGNDLMSSSTKDLYQSYLQQGSAVLLLASDSPTPVGPRSSPLSTEVRHARSATTLSQASLDSLTVSTHSSGGTPLPPTSIAASSLNNVSANNNNNNKSPLSSQEMLYQQHQARSTSPTPMAGPSSPLKSSITPIYDKRTSTVTSTKDASKRSSRFSDFFHSSQPAASSPLKLSADGSDINYVSSPLSASMSAAEGSMKTAILPNSHQSLNRNKTISGAKPGDIQTTFSQATSTNSVTPPMTADSTMMASADIYRGGTLKRLKGTAATGSNGTLNRLSRRFKDTMGFSDFDPGSAASETSSMFSFSVETEPSSAIDNEDVIDEVSFSLPATRTVQVYLRSARVSTQVQVDGSASVADLITATLEKLVKIPANNDLSMDPASWQIAKVDRNLLITRLWLVPTMSLEMYKINDGDELRLKEVTEKDNLIYCIPPSDEKLQLQFGCEDLIKNIIEKLVVENNLVSSASYGLYYKRVGIWLDEKRTLMSYELDPDHTIDLRIISQEFLLRIQLPEFDTRFTIKALPSLTVGDVIALIHYNLGARRIALEAFQRGGAADPFSSPFSRKTSKNNMKTIHYALCIPGRDLWLVENKTLEEYDLQKMTDDVQFKVQFRPLIIGLPEFMFSSYESKRIQSSEDDSSASVKSRYVQLFAGAGTFVRNMVEMLNIENPQFEDDVLALAANANAISSERNELYGIYTRGSERLADAELVWTSLKDASPLEMYEYRMAPLKVTVSSSLEPDTKLSVEINLTKNVGDTLPMLWRRFGVDGKYEFVGCSIAGVNGHLDPALSFMRQNFKRTSTLVLYIQQREVPVSISTSDDINIYDEPADSEENLKLDNAGDGLVTAGTFNKLVERLTSGATGGESTQYLDFMKTFLLTYQSFTTPTIFLQKLIQRYHVPRHINDCPTFGDFEKLRLKIQLRTVNVLQQWTKKFTADFVDLDAIKISQELNDFTTVHSEMEKRLQQAKSKHALLMQLLEFAETVVVADHVLLGRQLRKNLLRLRDGSFINMQQTATHVLPPPAPKYLRPADPNSKTSVFACDPEEVARQITVLEFELFSKITPAEFLNQAWTKPDADVRTPNVLQVTKRFNNIALWVAKSILEVKTVRARAKRVTKLIDIAAYLYSMNNFATLMAFIAGFNKAPVSRLKHTMKELTTKTAKKLSDLEHIMTAEGSYKNYRTKIHAVNPPCIPYLGVYLLDLTYMEDGNPNKIGKLINFSKRRLIHTLIREVQQYQDQPFNFKCVEDLVDILKKALDLPILQDSTSSPQTSEDGVAFVSLKVYEDQLFEVSLQREPRGADRSTIL